MAFVPRWILLGTILSVGTMMGACSTMKLRGHTQSVADTTYYAPPSYAGYQDAAPPPVSRNYSRPPAQPARQSRRQANVRYHRDDIQRPVRRAPDYGRQTYAEPDYRAPARSAPPARDYASAQDRSYASRQDRSYAAPQERSYALPPRVERQQDWTRDRQVVEQPPVVQERVVTQPVAQEPQFQRRGGARWIGQSWRGHQTSSGEMFDAERLTGAHASLPIPSFLYVTNRANGRTVLIRINDRVPASSDRVVIVSQRAAELLAFRGAGRAMVDLQYGGPAAPTANQKHEMAFLQKQPWFSPSLLSTRGYPNGAVTASRSASRYPPPNYPRWDNTQR